MNVIVDCNVLFSAAWKEGFIRDIFLSIVENHTIVISPHILREYRRIGSRQNTPRRRATYDAFLSLLVDIATVVDDSACPWELPDAHDLPYLQAAYHGAASVLVTGNLKDFPDEPYGIIRVLSPRQYADEFVTFEQQ